MSREGYFVAGYVRVCDCEDKIIILDLRADRYFGLSAADCRGLSSFVVGWPQPVTSDADTAAFSVPEALAVADGLVARGVLSRAEPRERRVGTRGLGPAGALLLDEDVPDRRGRVTGIHCANFVAAIATARVDLHIRSLNHAVERVANRKERRNSMPARIDVPHARSLVNAFCHLRAFFYTAKDACLLDSLALIEFLARYGYFPDWIIGVRPWPFAAHSWVQQDGFVLNCSLESVRKFTPILVV